MRSADDGLLTMFCVLASRGALRAFFLNVEVVVVNPNVVEISASLKKHTLCCTVAFNKFYFISYRR